MLTCFVYIKNDATFGFRYPVAQYAHSSTQRAIAGGFAYRGNLLPELWGRLVFGDIVSGRIWYASIADLEAADDGDPATLAAIRELELQYGGVTETLLQIEKLNQAINAKSIKDDFVLDCLLNAAPLKENLSTIYKTMEVFTFYMFRYKSAWCPYRKDSHDSKSCIFAHHMRDFR